MNQINHILMSIQHVCVEPLYVAKKALNIYRSFCGVSFSTKTFKKILVADALKHQAAQL